MKLKHTAIGLSLGGLLAMGAFGFFVAGGDIVSASTAPDALSVQLAQTEDPEPDAIIPDPQDLPGMRRGHQHRFGHDFDGLLSVYWSPELVHSIIADALDITVDELEEARAAGVTIEALAEQANVTVEDVQTAVSDAYTEAVNQAVADNAITQEQADMLLSREFTFGPRAEHGRGPGVDSELRALVDEIWPAEARQEALAGALGITVDQLEAARESRTPLSEIVEDLDPEAVRETMQTAWEDAVNQAAADGTITTEQAEMLLSLEHAPGGPGGARGHGGPRGRGGFAPGSGSFGPGNGTFAPGNGRFAPGNGGGQQGQNT